MRVVGEVETREGHAEFVNGGGRNLNAHGSKLRVASIDTTPDGKLDERILVRGIEPEAHGPVGSGRKQHEVLHEVLVHLLLSRFLESVIPYSFPNYKLFLLPPPLVILHCENGSQYPELEAPAPQEGLSEPVQALVTEGAGRNAKGPGRGLSVRLRGSLAHW